MPCWLAAATAATAAVHTEVRQTVLSTARIHSLAERGWVDFFILFFMRKKFRLNSEMSWSLSIVRILTIFDRLKNSANTQDFRKLDSWMEKRNKRKKSASVTVSVPKINPVLYGSKHVSHLDWFLSKIDYSLANKYCRTLTIVSAIECIWALQCSWETQSCGAVRWGW